MADKVYPPGSVKRNTETDEVALRTVFPEAGMAWLIATKNVGARNVATEDVAAPAWVDVYTAPAPEPAPESEE